LSKAIQAVAGGCCGIYSIRHDRILSSLGDEAESVSRRDVPAKPQSRKMPLRINQETGPQIVLFRRGFARFDSATLQMVSTRAMQCVLRDRLKTWE
jgi:hypothetical protein